MPLSASILAMLCLLAAGSLDLVLKLYTSKPRSQGMLFLGIGLIWAMLQRFNMEITGDSFSFAPPTLLYGISAAVFVTLSNILLLECMAHLPISLASTIYRLNTIPLVVLAFFFLDEQITWIRLLGIGFGLLTVFILYRPKEDGNELSPTNSKYVGLIVLACILRAFYGLFTKTGMSHGADVNTMIFMGALGWCGGGLLLAFFREKRILMTLEKLRFIGIGGLLVYAVVWLLTNALMLGDASFILPLTNMGFVAAFLFSILLRLESLNLRKIVAIVSAAIAIVLLTSSA